jgi:excisionase family DNA binding protein
MLRCSQLFTLLLSLLSLTLLSLWVSPVCVLEGRALCPDFEVYGVHTYTPGTLPAGYLMENINSNWLTANEAASYLRVKPATLLMWAREGKVKGFTFSGTHRHVWRFQHFDLDAMLTPPSIAPMMERTQ